MRILVISNYYPPAHVGGYEQECAGVVDHLRKRHEVLVLSSRFRRNESPPAEHVRRILPLHSWTKADSLRAPLRALGSARKMRALLASFDPDLIFNWNGAEIPQVVLRIAETSGRPVAYRVCEHWFGKLYRTDTFTRHLFPGDRGLRRLWAGLMRGVNRLPALRLDFSKQVPVAVSWVSAALREQTRIPSMVELVLERKVYYGIEQTAEPPRDPASTPLLAFIGRVTPRKAPDTAIRALATLKEQHGIEAELELAGPIDSGYEAGLRELADAQGVGESVRFLGPLDRAGMGSLHQRAHVVLVPSRWQEPAALVAVEAAAAAVPVVAARSGGLPELLRDGHEALLFDIDDYEGCAAATAAVLSDPEETASRVARAKARAGEFTPEAYYEATDQFLADVLEAFDKAPATSSRMASTE